MSLPIITTCKFSEERVFDLLGDKPPVRYLTQYLQSLNAVTILFEHDYVDRHGLADYDSHYAPSFGCPKAKCSRLHFFDKTEAEIENILDSAYRGGDSLKESEDKLQEMYLGFVEQRPLAGAALGLTILKTYPETAGRKYIVSRPYIVPLAGLKLCVEGLAYQQQYDGAAVCASTALWVALQRVAHMDGGNRAPSPSAITNASKILFAEIKGMDDRQMAKAVSSLGYIADQFEPGGNRLLFRMKLTACLNSHLPVILLITKKGEEGTIGHAVTVTGYNNLPESKNTTLVTLGETKLRMRGGAFRVLYVHDDNIGSHAHYELFDDEQLDSTGHPQLNILRGDKNRKGFIQGWNPDIWTVASALVPKPPKLRMTIEELVLTLGWLRETISEQVFPEFHPELNFLYDTHFISGVEYRRDLIGLKNFDSKDMEAFQRSLSLPRYIGILAIYDIEKGHLLDIIIDASKKMGRNSDFPNMLAIIAHGIPKRTETALRLIGFIRIMSECPIIIIGSPSDS